MGYKKNCCSRVAALVEVSSRNKLGLRKGKGGWGGNIITGGSSGRGRGRSAADSFDCRAHKRRNMHASCARGWYKKNCCSRVAALVEVSSRNKLGLRKGKGGWGGNIITGGSSGQAGEGLLPTVLTAARTNGETGMPAVPEDGTRKTAVLGSPRSLRSL